VLCVSLDLTTETRTQLQEEAIPSSCLILIMPMGQGATASYLHRVREKRVYGLLCITVTNLSIFSQFLAQITVIVHFTKNV